MGVLNGQGCRCMWGGVWGGVWGVLVNILFYYWSGLVEVDVDYGC